MSILMTGRLGDIFIICISVFKHIYIIMYDLFDIFYVCMNDFVYFRISSKYYKICFI